MVCGAGVLFRAISIFHSLSLLRAVQSQTVKKFNIDSCWRLDQSFEPRDSKPHVFPCFPAHRWAAATSVCGLQRPEKLLSLHNLLLGVMGGRAGAAAVCAGAHPVPPGIRDIRKAKTGNASAARARPMAKLLAEYRFKVNRAWVAAQRDRPAGGGCADRHRDHRFYRPLGPGLAATASARRAAGGDKQGGSTITQQLARKPSTPRTSAARPRSRASPEAITALKIDKRCTPGRDPGDLSGTRCPSSTTPTASDGGARISTIIDQLNAWTPRSSACSKGIGLLQPVLNPRARPGAAQHH